MTIKRVMVCGAGLMEHGIGHVVAAHELDPYTAADRLLAALATPQ